MRSSSGSRPGLFSWGSFWRAARRLARIVWGEHWGWLILLLVVLCVYAVMAMQWYPCRVWVGCWETSAAHGVGMECRPGCTMAP